MQGIFLQFDHIFRSERYSLGLKLLLDNGYIFSKYFVLACVICALRPGNSKVESVVSLAMGQFSNTRIFMIHIFVFLRSHEGSLKIIFSFGMKLLILFKMVSLDSATRYLIPKAERFLSQTVEISYGIQYSRVDKVKFFIFHKFNLVHS